MLPVRQDQYREHSRSACDIIAATRRRRRFRRMDGSTSWPAAIKPAAVRKARRTSVSWVRCEIRKGSRTGDRRSIISGNRIHDATRRHVARNAAWRGERTVALRSFDRREDGSLPPRQKGSAIRRGMPTAKSRSGSPGACRIEWPGGVLLRVFLYFWFNVDPALGGTGSRLINSGAEALCWRGCAYLFIWPPVSDDATLDAAIT